MLQAQVIQKYMHHFGRETSWQAITWQDNLKPIFGKEVVMMLTAMKW